MGHKLSFLKNLLLNNGVDSDYKIFFGELTVSVASISTLPSQITQITAWYFLSHRHSCLQEKISEENRIRLKSC